MKIEEMKEKQELTDQRILNQELNKDYEEDHERCGDCGTLLNSHSHCPRCDY